MNFKSLLIITEALETLEEEEATEEVATIIIIIIEEVIKIKPLIKEAVDSRDKEATIMVEMVVAMEEDINSNNNLLNNKHSNLKDLDSKIKDLLSKEDFKEEAKFQFKEIMKEVEILRALLIAEEIEDNERNL